MARKKDDKEVELRFEFDRLGSKKLSLAYRLLVPLLEGKQDGTITQIDDDEQISCDIHQGIFGTTKGSSNDR